MRLYGAAKHFNKVPCLDAYTGELLFYGQMQLYDDSKRDAEVTERRVLSVEPTVQIPFRRVIEAQDTRYILGHGTQDWFQGRPLRMGLVAHEATFLSEVRTLTQVATGQAGYPMWSANVWVKNLAYTEQSSQLPRQYHIHLAQSEDVNVNDVVTLADGDYLVREKLIGPVGTLSCLADQMPSPLVQTATVETGSYDPVTETRTGTVLQVPVVNLRWQSLFSYGSQDAPKFGPDSTQLLVAKANLAARPGMRLTLPDGVHQVESVTSMGATWLMKAVRHA